MGNIHPRFWAWYMGTSNFTGALADFIAAVQGSKLGGGNHVAALIDQQVVQWLRAAINNHRTRPEDLDLLITEARRIGRDILATPG